MSGSLATEHAVTNSPTFQCDCWAATLRIVERCSGDHIQSQSPSNPQAPHNNTSTSLLSDTLTEGGNLVRHWETLNGCANSASHMTPQTLQYIAESISWVLHDYEMAVDAISNEMHTLSRPSLSMPTPALSFSSTPSFWDTERAAESSIPRAFVGNLELDAGEAVLVAQEALGHSIARLTVLLQEIEEEDALQRQEPGMEYRLRQENSKGIISRTFRLLGRVNKLA